VRIKTLKKFAAKSLAALRVNSSECHARPFAEFRLGHTHPVRVDKLAFPLALLEQNLRILRLANLRFALRNASFLQLSKNSSRIASRISAPGGAPHWFGAAAAKRPEMRDKIKNPASSAGPVLPQTWRGESLEARQLSIRCSYPTSPRCYRGDFRSAGASGHTARSSDI